MTHGSLFSGIGGFDLAAKWTGWTNVFQCEIDQFCQKVLKYHFPKTELYHDIKQTDFTKYRGKVEIVSGGFPCQPFSVAGKRRGTADNRYLWSEMLRAIREIQPRWIVGENVLGIVNWNEGLVFEQVCSDLEIEGYEVQPFVLPACSQNAPHQRYRVWFIAHTKHNRFQRSGFEKTRKKNGKTERKGTLSNIGNALCSLQKGITPDTNVKGLQGCEYVRQSELFEQNAQKGIASDTTSERTRKLPNQSQTAGTQKSDELLGEQHSIPNWDNFPTQFPVCRGNDGLPTKLHNITFPKWRNESVKSYGNAVVPQIPFQIFSVINDYENLIKNKKI